MWRGDEKCLELSRNLHNIGISGAQKSELVSISRTVIPVDRDRHGYTLQVSFLLEWQRHLLLPTAERETTARSSSIAPANSYTWNVDCCYLNYRGLMRATENSIEYIHIIHEHMWISFTTDSYWPIWKNTFVLQKLYNYITYL